MSTEVIAPTVVADPNFNAEKDCEALRNAMRGIGTDESVLIGVLCKRSWQQRVEIVSTYQQMFGKDLDKRIKDEVGGHFYDVLKRLLKTPTDLAAFELHNAIKGAGTDEEALIEIICTNSNENLRAIKTAYKQLYGKSLEEDVSSDTSGFFRRFLLALLSCDRPSESAPDLEAAAADAKALYDAGQNRVGTDEVRFNVILCSRSYSQLQAIFAAYHREYKVDIAEVIASEFSGDICRALISVVFAIRNRPAYFATRLQAAMEGTGTRDHWLLRIIIMRCDFDLAAVKTEYQRLYGKSLSKAVQDETKGDYKKALLTLIGD